MMRAISWDLSFHDSQAQASFTSSVSTRQRDSKCRRTNTSLPAFFVILLSIGSQIYLLPKLHEIRDTLAARFLWVAPAFSALLLGICIIMDFALLAQLKSDPIVQQPAPPTPGNPSKATVIAGGSFYL